MPLDTPEQIDRIVMWGFGIGAAIYALVNAGRFYRFVVTVVGHRQAIARIQRSPGNAYTSAKLLYHPHNVKLLKEMRIHAVPTFVDDCTDLQAIMLRKQQFSVTQFVHNDALKEWLNFNPYRATKQFLRQKEEQYNYNTRCGVFVKKSAIQLAQEKLYVDSLPMFIY